MSPPSDTVERLRAFTVDRGEPTMPINVHPTCCIDGADEIARLRADQAKYHQNLTEIAQQHVKDLDRLRAELAEARDRADTYFTDIDRLRTDLAAARRAVAASVDNHVREQTCLRAELAVSQQSVRDYTDWVGSLQCELAASERARLIAVAVQQELSDELASARAVIERVEDDGQ